MHRQPVRFATISLFLFGIGVLAPQQTEAAGRYDGNWVGVPALDGASNPNCPAWKQMRLSIAGDRFNQDIGRTPMQGGIGPEGSFSTTASYALQHQGMERAEFSGRAAGNQINAVYHTKFCTYNMTLHRQ